jgi:cellobiose phosphorylase
MARQRGESVAFSAYYASNLRLLGEMLLELEKFGVTEVELLSEMLPLLDSVYNPVDYESPAGKQQRLAQYFESVSGVISGQKIRIPLTELAADLLSKADWMVEHLRASEWIQSASGYAWFNGYYDNDGQRLEGDFPGGVRMTLAGQVFALMGGIASDEQALQIVRAADHFLLDPKEGGHRLNTDFGEVLLNMGRCFGFAYGHKENGAMFSHMAVMYAYALYERGFGRKGFEALNRIYRQSCDFNTSHIYPGIPEYFNPRGRGMYPYLTGSASWYLLTLTTRAFGVRGKNGDLLLAPMLMAEQFDTCGEASLKIHFAGRRLEVSYHNPGRLDYGDYRIGSVRLDGEALPLSPAAQVILGRPGLLALAGDRRHVIEVDLG